MVPGTKDLMISEAEISLYAVAYTPAPVRQNYLLRH